MVLLMDEGGDPGDYGAHLHEVVEPLLVSASTLCT